MVDDIRKNLDKVTGELLESFLPFDKSRVRTFQAGLHALHTAQQDLEPGQKTNLHAVCDYPALERLLGQHGIDKQDFDKVPSVLKQFEDGELDAFEAIKQLPHLLQEAVQKVNENTRAIYEVPQSGMIAVMLNLVSNDAKNALIAGRAGERTLQTVERIANKYSNDTGRVSAASILSDRLYEIGNPAKLARSYIDRMDGQPGYLLAARANNHLADLLEGAIMLNPALSKEDSVQRALQAHRFITRRVFLKSSSMLKESGADEAASNIASLVEYMAAYTSDEQVVMSIEEAVETIRSTLEDANKSLEGLLKISREEAVDFDSLLLKRLGQLRELDPA